MDVVSFLTTLIGLLIFAIGLAGTLIPVMPGILIIGIGGLWMGLTGSHDLTWWQWLIFFVLMIIGLVIDKLCGAFGAKKFGSTCYGMIGALVGGLLIGAAMGGQFLGGFVGAFLGATLAELLFARKHLVNAFRAGTGATLGLIVGMLMEFVCGLIMIGLFCGFYFF